MNVYVTLAILGLGGVLFGSMIYLEYRPPNKYWVTFVPTTGIMLISICILLVALVHLKSYMGLQTAAAFPQSSSLRELKEEELRKFLWPVVAIPAVLGGSDAPSAQNTLLTAGNPTQEVNSSPWKRECQGGAGTSSELCFVRQFVRTKNGQTVLVVTVGMVRGSKNEARAILTTPLNVSLLSGLAIKVDDKDQEQFNFSDCSRTGCRAIIPLQSERLDQFRKGAVVRVGWKMKDSKQMVVPIDLRGFSAAVSSLVE